MTNPTPPLEFQPVTPANWDDFTALFGPHGACAGCWCLWWRFAPRPQITVARSDENKATMKAVVDSGKVPGILAYQEGKLVAWVSVGPREDFPALERTRNLRRMDDTPVWSIVCFYVAVGRRREGLLPVLIRGALDYARSQGAQVVEAYPYVRQPDQKMYSSSGYMGILSAYQQVGFVEALRRSPAQPILRYTF